MDGCEHSMSGGTGFGKLKHHLILSFHSNMQVEMAVCELRMQDRDFYFDIIFNLMPHWKNASLCTLKNSDTSEK